MKYLLLTAIKCYWLIIPPNKRRTCLFKKSCSHFVFDATATHGLLIGLKALNYRFRNCRAGTLFFTDPHTGKTMIVLPNKDIIAEEEISEIIITRHLKQALK